MSATLKIGNWDFNLADYTVEEEATPLAAGDSRGSVGLLRFTLNAPDPDVDYVQDTGWKFVRDNGHLVLRDQPFVFTDSDRGFVTGRTGSVSWNQSGSSLEITGSPRLSLLNAYNVQMPPYRGTLGGAIGYYLNRAGIISGYTVDSSIANRTVYYPGWFGELWYHLKMLMAAQSIELNAINDVFVFQPIRRRTMPRGFDTSFAIQQEVPTLAQAIEVYNYNNLPLEAELAYPPGGWNPEVEVLNVNAGETAEYTLELSSSLEFIDTPTMLQYVSPNESSASVYTVVANDGLPVAPSLWRENGGMVNVTINPDTVTLKVSLRGATNIPTAEGIAATHFSLALASDTTGNRYSTLRIVGQGVKFDKQKVRIRTGITPAKAPTEIGVTIDNPFISNLDQLYRAGTKAARQYAGPLPSISGVLSKTLPYGNTSQLFGEFAGSRVYDVATGRPYRVQSASTTPATLNYQADSDFTHGDVLNHFQGQSYEQVRLHYAPLTYSQAEDKGLR